MMNNTCHTPFPTDADLIPADVAAARQFAAEWADAKVILADGKELYLGELPIGATRWRTSDGPFFKVRPDRVESAVIWDPAVTYIEP